MQPVGYLVNHPSGLSGAQGTFYDYALASNGLFIKAEGPLLKATINIAPVEIRGLAPLEQKVELIHGKVPDWQGRAALNAMRFSPEQEVYLAITWIAWPEEIPGLAPIGQKDGKYRLILPPQEGEGGHVNYHTVPNTLVHLHSHPMMDAFFSSTDNKDEQGLGIYIVVGKLHEGVPEATVRAGVYGYFAEMDWGDVFVI